MCLCKKQSIWGVAIPSRPSPKMEKKNIQLLWKNYMSTGRWFQNVSKPLTSSYSLMKLGWTIIPHQGKTEGVESTITRKHCGSGIEHHAIEILVRNLSWQSFGSLLLGDLRPMALRHTEKMCRSRMWTMINIYIHIIYIYTI